MRIALFLSAFALAGCASQSQDVVASYVSPVQYGQWSCVQISNEAYRIENRMAAASGLQDRRARHDAITAVIPPPTFIPAAFYGNDAQTNDLARLKG